MTENIGPSQERLRSCVLFHEGLAQGAGVAVQRVLPGLRGRGWSTYAWFPYEGPLLELVEPLVDGSRFRQGSFAFSVAGWRRPPGPVRRVTNLAGYFRALRSMLAEVSPDVVHANTLLSLPEATVAHRMGLPVVLHMHELPPLSRKTDLTLRWVAAIADVVVTVSDAVHERFAPYAASTSVVRVYNGLPESVIATPVTDRSTARFTVGTVGGVTYRKGTDVFLDAAREAIAARSDVDFLHVGPPPWEGESRDFVEAIRTKLQTLAPERVTMAGMQPAERMLPTMDVFVMASREEPFALASLEAMAAGLPVIATDVGGFPEQIEHGRSGVIVASEDPHAIAEWVGRLHDDVELRGRLGNAARERVRERFTLERQCDGLDAAYRMAIAGGSQASA
jgi:glycosyltransferase involved in cell wall biosynthesis